MHFSQDLCSALLIPLLPLIRTDFGLSYLQSGLLLSAYNITSGLSQFLGGSLGYRVRLQVIATVGLGGVGLTTLAAGLSEAYYPLLGLLIVMGIFSGGYHPASNSMLSTFFDTGKRGKVVGFHMLGGTLGLAIAPIVGGLIADKLNWHFAFVILSFPAILASSLVFSVLKNFGRREQASTVGAESHTSPRNDSTAQATKRQTGIGQVWRPVIAVVSLTLLSQVLTQAAIAFIPMYFVDKEKIAAVTAAMFVGILRVGGIPGGLFGGWLTDRYGGRKAVVMALVATGPMLYLITTLPVNAFLMATLVAFGALLIVRQTAVQTFLMDNTAPQIRSTVFGIYFGLSHEGASIAQPVVGYFMDIFGIAAVFNLLALTSVAMSLVTPLLLRPRRHRSASCTPGQNG